jgi:hypothetical protein
MKRLKLNVVLIQAYIAVKVSVFCDVIPCSFGRS